MVNRKVIWIDERTSDYIDRPWDFSDAFTQREVDLVVCGEGATQSMIPRAAECNRRFKRALDEIFANGSEAEVIGFIVDVNMALDSLGTYSNSGDMRGVNLEDGTYTGYKIAQYVLANERRNLSPYGNAFAEKPILFLSVSPFHRDMHNRWMGDAYVDCTSDSRFAKYSHLQKTFLKKEIRSQMKAWIDYIVSLERGPVDD